MTWWKRAQQAAPPQESVADLRRLLHEAQSDITVLYDQLERINNRLKQRASRAARSDSTDRSDHDSDDLRLGDGGDFVRPTPVGEVPSSALAHQLPHSSDLAQLPDKEAVRALWRQRQAGRA